MYSAYATPLNQEGKGSGKLCVQQVILVECNNCKKRHRHLQILLGQLYVHAPHAVQLW